MTAPQPEHRTPSIKPTSAATLAVAGLAAAGVGLLTISYWYWDIGRLPWLPAAVLLVLAIGEVALAQQTKARIERKPGRPPVEPLQVARFVALAKASSLAGAICTGFTAVLAGWLLTESGRVDAAGRDLPIALLLLLASAALTAAGLWLERACRVPKQPEDEQQQR